MSDIVLRNTARAQIQLTNLVERLRDRLAEQEGQDTIEYLGVLIVVAAVILAVYQLIPGLKGTISKGAKQVIQGVFNA